VICAYGADHNGRTIPHGRTTGSIGSGTGPRSSSGAGGARPAAVPARGVLRSGWWFGSGAPRCTPTRGLSSSDRRQAAREVVVVVGVPTPSEAASGLQITGSIVADRREAQARQMRPGRHSPRSLDEDEDEDEGEAGVG